MIAGIDAGLARKFVAEGCAVALLSRSTVFSSSLVAELTARGGNALALKADVSDSTSVDRAFEQIHQQLGPVDILVNHAPATHMKKPKHRWRDRWLGSATPVTSAHLSRRVEVWGCMG